MYFDIDNIGTLCSMTYYLFTPDKRLIVKMNSYNPYMANEDLNHRHHMETILQSKLKL